jgi:hypothetical protein
MYDSGEREETLGRQGDGQRVTVRYREVGLLYERGILARVPRAASVCEAVSVMYQ